MPTLATFSMKTTLPALPVIHVDITCQQQEPTTKRQRINGPQQHQSQMKNKKSVSFNDRVRVRKTRHLNNYTDAEIGACWLSDEECSTIKKSVLSEIRYFEEKGGMDDGSEGRCLRGVEGRLSSESSKRRQQRFLAIDTVLLEQENQHSHGAGRLSDVDSLRALYHQVVSSDASTARSRGLQDELALRNNC